MGDFRGSSLAGFGPRVIGGEEALGGKMGDTEMEEIVSQSQAAGRSSLPPPASPPATSERFLELPAFPKQQYKMEHIKKTKSESMESLPTSRRSVDSTRSILRKSQDYRRSCDLGIGRTRSADYTGRVQFHPEEQTVVLIPARQGAWSERFKNEQAMLFKMTAPIIANQILNFLLNLVDIAMVGHLGQEELAAAGLAIAYYNVFYVRESPHGSARSRTAPEVSDHGSLLQPFPTSARYPPILDFPLISLVLPLLCPTQAPSLNCHTEDLATLAVTDLSPTQYPLSGAAMALDTLLSQSFGAQQFALYGNWLVISLIVMFVMCIPCAIFGLLAKPILMGLGLVIPH